MSHWYLKDGTPNYQILGANGKLRDVTLRDARKLNLFPSTTGIIQIIDKPALGRWKMIEGMKATLRLLERVGGEVADEVARLTGTLAMEGALPKPFIDECMFEADTIAREAREEGSRVHDALEHWINGRKEQVPDKYIPHCEAAVAKLVEAFGPMEDAAWVTEESFACKEGYGGRSDIGSRAIKVLGDYKGKDFDLDHSDGPECYDEHDMQLASYRHGLDYDPDTTCFIMYVSTTRPGHVKLCIRTPEQIKRGHDLFMASLHLWQVKNNFKPEW